MHFSRCQSLDESDLFINLLQTPLLLCKSIACPLQLVTLFLGVVLQIWLWHCLVMPCVPRYSSWGAVGACEPFHLCCHLCFQTCSLLPSCKHPSRLYLCTSASHFSYTSAFLQLWSQQLETHEKFQSRSRKDSEEPAKYWKAQSQLATPWYFTE